MIKPSIFLSVLYYLEYLIGLLVVVRYAWLAIKLVTPYVNLCCLILFSFWERVNFVSSVVEKTLLSFVSRTEILDTVCSYFTFCKRQCVNPWTKGTIYIPFKYDVQITSVWFLTSPTNLKGGYAIIALSGFISVCFAGISHKPKNKALWTHTHTKKCSTFSSCGRQLIQECPLHTSLELSRNSRTCVISLSNNST